MLEAILGIEVAILVLILYYIIHNILCNELVEYERRKYNELKNSLDCANNHNERLVNNIHEQKELLVSLFGDYTYIATSIDPLTNKHYIICYYDYGKRIRWEIKGTEYDIKEKPTNE